MAAAATASASRTSKCPCPPSSNSSATPATIRDESSIPSRKPPNDFRFWILDFGFGSPGLATPRATPKQACNLGQRSGLEGVPESNPKSKIQNPKSKMVTVVGSLNLDLFIEAPRLPAPGETVLSQR